MSNLRKYFELETKEERWAFLEGLTSEEREQMWNVFIRDVCLDFVDVLAPAFDRLRQAIERFAEACKNSGIDLTQIGGDHE